MEDYWFAGKLLKWFHENGRPLPWRETRDPYLIWLSEIILQQTRIEQGQPYWERFVGRWPRVEMLAAATEDEVLRLWQGLGYYSRARNLHTAARQIVERGRFPNTFSEIRQLKGVGDYTAAAIASIAFDEPVAVVDGNVYRLLSRHFAIETPINTTEGKKQFTQLANQLLPPHEASAFNQAMMDFGAIQCTPQSPRCLLCPLADSCLALAEGSIAKLPVKLKKLTVKERRMTYVYIRHNGCVAIRRRPAGDIWQGLWEPYLLPEGQKLEEAFPNADLRLLRKDVKHVLTHRILLADFYLWEPTERLTLPDGYQWTPEADLNSYALPRLIEQLVKGLAGEIYHGGCKNS